MLRRVVIFLVIAIVFVIGVLLGSRPASVQGADDLGTVPQKGGQEQTGHYEVVRDWPKPLTSLPGHEKWTWGSPEGIFAENPNRIYVVERGELQIGRAHV